MLESETTIAELVQQLNHNNQTNIFQLSENTAVEKKINDICGWSTQRGNYPKPPLLLELIVFQAVSFEFIFSFCCTSSQESKALAKRTRKSMQVDGSLQNQYLRMELRWVAKRIRKSARKLQIFYAHTDDLQSTCIDLHWVAKR